MIISFDVNDDAGWESIAIQAAVKNITNEEISVKKPMHTSVLTETEKDIVISNLEERLAELDQELERQKKEMENIVESNHKFISIIAHDLRSPFNSILGYLELLKKNVDSYDKEKIEVFLEFSYSAALKTFKLLDSLLEWASSKNGKIAFVPAKLNLQSLINEEISFVEFIARKKNIIVKHQVLDSYYVYADLQMIRSVLRNLLNNAIKFTNEGGEINIWASIIGEYIEISVQDNGIGVAPEVLPDLFKLNAIHSTKGTGNERGNGLGLLTCKEFIELHGGCMHVESTLGNGSTFKFTLPRFIE